MSDTIGGSGVTLEELSAYFDAGRTPSVAAIESDAECVAMLASMERMARTTRELVAEDASRVELPWLDRVLDVVRAEVRAGRDLTIESLDDRTETTVTEGALRELARRAGDGVAGVLVGSVALRQHDAVLDVRVTIAVRYGSAVRDRAEEVRVAVHAAVAPHAPTAIGSVDVVVDDILDAEDEEGDGDA